MPDKDKEKKLVLWFEECGIKDVPIVGGKNASLGEMIEKTKVPVPTGFALTAHAYRYFIEKNNLVQFIRDTLADLDTQDMKNLAERGEKIRNAIQKAKMPEDLEKLIRQYYKELGKKSGIENPSCAVRSSATAEDLPDASFAGQQETYLHISGEDVIIAKCIECMASLFTNRAISYRVDKGFDHFDVALSVGIQLMIYTDLGAAGVGFSIDTESGFDKVVMIEGSWGLGEFVVQGKVNPDNWYVFKPTKGIIGKSAGNKLIKLVRNEKKEVVQVDVAEKDRKKFVLTDEQVKELAGYIIQIEKHYGKPMDIEWGLDGRNNKIYILQARPETVESQKTKEIIETYVNLMPADKRKLLITGDAVGRKIGQGTANIITNVKDIGKFKEGEVLVAIETDPDWEPIMKKAAAIVTNHGGRTCHAAIVSRELGIPCVIGTENGSNAIKSGQNVTIDCSEGFGNVYEGLLKYEIKRLDLEKIPETKTQILMNVGIPETAFDQGKLPVDGVGLARLEFIINSHIQIHPLALINYNELKKDKKNADIIKKIDELTIGYDDKAHLFVDRLAEGVARIAASFHPNPVIVRLSDFKTNEYANLIGGHLYEPEEHNPMIGWRGASRYYDKTFLPAFILECQALKKVREEMGLANVKIMIPFCRTVEEGKRVIKIMNDNGLVQGKNDLEIYVMAEIPSNIILADQFSEIFDGFSIGSNDLTQLTLGLDRDSEIISHLFDERNLALKRSVKNLIDTAHKFKRKVGICGQSPSDWPSFAAYLIECGIDSLSLNPDTVIKTRLLTAIVEWALSKGKKFEELTDDEILHNPVVPEELAKIVVDMIKSERSKS
ncbi:MAG TPA: phosphoenolpyruvate synthase [Candidatus Deferrimicrobium sp.]|nr:phosphoenolpyruvate synthase [Candidatus Deferrimicrobium sp.]